jgi:GAF domain-containing protein
MKNDFRYESFCSWVVQDDTGRGVTVMDARTDPRCTHFRYKPNFEFYAGVPLITSDGIRIGALSLRGPARTQFSTMDMNLMHELSSWAIGEIEMISLRRDLESRELMQRARAKIGRLIDAENEVEKGMGLVVVENVPFES